MVKNSLEFIDLFAGIGGFRLGMERAGHKCVGFVEWDESARKSYESIHNTDGEWSGHDIKSVDYREIPRADCWCLGFPCTNISKNGKGEGIQGDHSGTFFAATGLVRKQKKEDKPRYLFIENVEQLLDGNDGHDFLRLLIELDEIGYDAEWQIINSRDHGTPQNRKRVYIIGHLRESSTRTIFPLKASYQPTNLSTAIRDRRRRVIEEGWKVKNATKQGYDIATRYDAVNMAFPNSKTRRGRKGEMVFQTLDTSCRQAIFDPEKERWRQITPREAWRIQGFPDEAYDRALNALQGTKLTEKQLIKALYKQAGNAVSVKVIEQIAKRLA